MTWYIGRALWFRTAILVSLEIFKMFSSVCRKFWFLWTIVGFEIVMVRERLSSTDWGVTTYFEIMHICPNLFPQMTFQKEAINNLHVTHQIQNAFVTLSLLLLHIQLWSRHHSFDLKNIFWGNVSIILKYHYILNIILS